MPRCTTLKPVCPLLKHLLQDKGDFIPKREPQGHVPKHGRSNTDDLQIIKREMAQKKQSELFTRKSEEKKKKHPKREPGRMLHGLGGPRWASSYSGHAPLGPPALPHAGATPTPQFRERAHERFGSWTAAPQPLLPPALTPWVGLTQPAPHLVTHLQAYWLRSNWWGRQSLGRSRPEHTGPLALARARAVAGTSKEGDDVQFVETLWGLSPSRRQQEGQETGSLFLGRKNPRRVGAAWSLWEQRLYWQPLAAGEGGAPARAGGGPGWQPDAGSWTTSPTCVRRGLQMLPQLSWPRGRSLSGGKGCGKLFPRQFPSL